MDAASTASARLRELLIAGGVVAARSGPVAPAHFDAVRASLMVARGDVTSDRFTFRNPSRSANPPGWARWSVAVAVGYPVGEGSGDGLRVAAYARTDTYSSLRDLLSGGVAILREEGIKAAYSIDSNGAFDKAFARRNRLGWVGRNTLVMIPGWGPAVVIGTILTGTPIEIAIGREAGRWPCGSCARCQMACPTGALTGGGEIVPKLCVAWVGQKESLSAGERRALGTRVYGCDECIVACPVGSRRRRPLPTLPPSQITEASPEEVIDRFGHWYIPRRDPRFVYRNALVALANRGRYDRYARQAVVRFLLDEDSRMRREALLAWLALRHHAEAAS